MKNILSQSTIVYHSEYGKGKILSIIHRRTNDLFMCYFPKAQVHDFITAEELLTGKGHITLEPSKSSSTDVPKSLEQALTDLIGRLE